MTALDLINDQIDHVEQKALSSLAYRKYMMFGYYKSVAVHLRKVARQIRELEKAFPEASKEEA